MFWTTTLVLRKHWRFEMDKSTNRIQKILLNLIYSSLIFSLVYVLGLGIRLEINSLLQMLIVLITSTLVKFFLLNPLILYAILVVGFLGAILVHRFITPVFFTLGERAFYLFENVINNLQGKEDVAPDNIMLFWLIIIVLISIFTAFIIFKIKNIYLLLPIYIGSFLIYWYNFFDEAYWMISIFLVLFLVLMGIDKYFKKAIQSESDAGHIYEELYTPWLKTVTMYSILIVLIALLLPKSNNYIEWSWLQQKISTTFPSFEKLRSSNSSNRNLGQTVLFNFSITGYQEDTSRLGGPLKLSDQKIMTVRANSRNYLRGTVRHIYTGESWRTMTEPSKYYELGQDFSGLSKEEQELYYEKESITITNHSFASTTLFSPYQAVEVDFNNKNRLIVSSDNALFFSDGMYNGESYNVQVLKPLPYGILVSLGMNKKKADISNIEVYLQTPENKTTERTKALVEEIIKDSNSDFQKAVAIETYLRKNHKYNLNVDKVPESKDFVDYFLFDKQEGYCTYFATSMAMMLRLSGIPSRYIEGYLVQEPIESNTYEVRHKDAHAWVEAFIEPVGWMTFEPTPIYNIEPRLENYSLNTIGEERFEDEIDWSRRIPSMGLDNEIIDDNQDIMSGETASISEGLSKTNSLDSAKNIISIFIRVLLLIIPIRFLLGFIQYRYKEVKAKKLSNNNRVIYLYNQIVKLMNLLGCPQQYGETHYEYANRVAYKYYFHNEKTIKEITEIFVTSKYSNSPTSKEDVLLLEDYRNTFYKRLRNHFGPVVYYYRKYVKCELF